MSSVRHTCIQSVGKQEFLEQPAGHWLISNTLEKIGDLEVPLVLEQLPHRDEREALWDEVGNRLRDRTAYVFEHLEDARRFFGFDCKSRWGFEV